MSDTAPAAQSAPAPTLILRLLMASPLRPTASGWQWWASICSRHPFLDPACDLCQNGDWVPLEDADLLAALESTR